jgi:uncharacterized protein YjbJ (UPF0337 family)
MSCTVSLQKSPFLRKNLIYVRYRTDPDWPCQYHFPERGNHLPMLPLRPFGHNSLIQEKLMNKDQVKGKIEEVKGKIKEAAGVVMDDKAMEAEGNVQKNVGKIQKGLGDLKEDLKGNK